MMRFDTWEKGASLSFYGRLEAETLQEIKTAGIDCVELSFPYDYYMRGLDFVNKAEEYAAMAKEAGVELWSMHLPFSGNLDISHRNDELRSITLYTNTCMIRAAAAAGIKVIVLHPSSEPIAKEDRPERMRRSQDAIKELNALCESLGMKLAVENLPRTCLCRNSTEMIELLRGTGAGVVFDTNHNLEEDNVHFVNALTGAGLKIRSLHISEYYQDENGVLDERHCLPGEGINRWQELMQAIENNGYEGPLMYEISRRPANHEQSLATRQMYANMCALQSGEIL